MVPKAPPARGDLTEVRWVDIAEDPCGNPDSATLSRRTSYGLFWEQRQDHGIDVVVTTTTVDENHHDQAGYCIYPLACVVRLKVIKRARKGKA